MLRQIPRRAMLAMGLGAAWLASTGIRLDAEGKRDEPARPVKVRVYAEKLAESDQLVDGPEGTRIELKGETTLIWVDLMPGARFAHPTEYLLVTAKGTRVVKGEWWPVLNGKPLFTDRAE